MSKTDETDYSPSQSEKAEQRAKIESATAEFLNGHDIEQIEPNTRTIILSAEKIKKSATWGDSDNECKKGK